MTSSLTTQKSTPELRGHGYGCQLHPTIVDTPCFVPLSPENEAIGGHGWHGWHVIFIRQPGSPSDSSLALDIGS